MLIILKKEHEMNWLEAKETNVYICKSKTATKHHLNKGCRGLNACKSKIVKITLKEAKKEEKKLCNWED